MWFVYVLYSISAEKTYVGFTNNLERRFMEHNVTEATGFTLRYRPWILIRFEKFSDKTQAMKREKFLKSGQGRESIKLFVKEFQKHSIVVRYPPEAEKD